MMHNHSIAIALTDSKNKPYREYNYKKITDLCKLSEIILPYNEEYKLLLKNDNSIRIKVDIDIDGSLITGSGGLIINSNSSSYLERFLDTDKKLLFVKANDERVGDPTSKENGLLTVKVELEKATTPSIFSGWVHRTPWPYYDPCYYPNYHYYKTTVYCSSNSGLYNEMPTYSNCNVGSAIGASAVNQFTACASNATPTAQPEVGATVEGGKSNQVFSSTYWNGSEGSALIFQFKMLGRVDKVSEKDIAERQEYERLKAKFG
jgi:hypothetical protein